MGCREWGRRKSGVGGVSGQGQGGVIRKSWRRSFKGEGGSSSLRLRIDWNNLKLVFLWLEALMAFVKKYYIINI